MVTALRRLGGTTLGLLAAAMLACVGPTWAQSPSPSGSAVDTRPRVAPSSRADIQFSFAPLVKKTAPAVVNIFTKRTVRTVPSPLFNDPFFRRFFGDQFPGSTPESVQNSLGSGVIVDPVGIIVTNHHVIRGADEITVVLADRREFEAQVVRTDERTDLAVLRITPGAERLPALELRDSDDLEVGDLVLAIGNPFGVGQTVTSGIVSATARTMVGITDYRFFIQTDAAINPGNSGGALVSMDGRLVGINTAIFARDGGGSIGLGFAIPSNMVATVVAGLANGGAAGRLVRPWFGARGQNVTAEIANSLGLPRPGGVLLTEVFPGSPAERAGLRRGDVVTHIENREVADGDALRFRIATHMVGGTLRVTTWRDGRERVVPVALIAPPETPPRDTTLLRGNHPLAGATVANLSPALMEELGMTEGAPRGVIVLETRRGSPAFLIRIQSGDQILRINERDVKTVEDVRRITASMALPWRLSIVRADKLITLVVGG